MSGRGTKEVFMEYEESQLGPERWKPMEFGAITTGIEMSQNVELAMSLCNAEWKSG